MLNSNAEPLDTTIDIVTPENISFHYRVAGPFRRLPALVADYLLRITLYGALWFALTMALALLVWLLPPLRGMAEFLFGGGVAFMIVLWFVLDWFYGGLFETYWNGQTPGKRMLGIRVVTTSGQPINGLQAVMRNVFRYADLFPFLSLRMLNPLFGGEADMALPDVYLIPTLLVGLATMFLNRRFQRLGDLLCGTMVIIEERKWLAGVARLEDPRAAQLASFLPVDFVVSRPLAVRLGVIRGSAAVLHAGSAARGGAAPGRTIDSAVRSVAGHEPRFAVVRALLPYVRRRPYRRRTARVAARSASDRVRDVPLRSSGVDIFPCRFRGAEFRAAADSRADLSEAPRMKVAQLLETRRQNWQELELLCDQFQRSRRSTLTSNSVTRFTDLYRAACADLALADAYQLPPDTIQYLHQLVGRAHNQLYHSRPFDLAYWGQVLLYDVPQKIFLDRCVHVAFCVFWGIFILSAVLAYSRTLWPTYAEDVLGETMIAQLEESFRDPLRDRPYSTNVMMAAFYISHNTGIGMKCFVGGLLIVPGLFITLFNAGFLGASFGYMAQSRRARGEEFF